MTAALTDGYEGLVHQNDEGINTLSVLVKGVHCALCIQKIESKLKSQSEVDEARLNFSTGRLNIQWHGDAANANEYVKNIEQLGYGVAPYSADIEKTTSENENRFLLLCLGVAGFALGNIMLLSVGLWVTDEQTMGWATRSFMHWLSALIAIPAILFSGRPFFKSAWGVLKDGQTNMDVPISLALILATGMSVFETINHGEHVYFDSAVMLMFFLLIGRYLDFRARQNARSSATDLMQTLSGFATVVENGKTRRVLIRDVSEGMNVLVAAGEKIPVDGVIENGVSSIDTSLITGETLPRDVKAGDDVYAGTMNQSASITIAVSKAADDSLLADIVRLMEKAEQGQAKYVRLADRAARLYTPVVHTMALLAFILWWGIFGVDWQDALLIAVTVLIITCPCALGLAVPVVQVLATGTLMKRGLIVKSGDALERLADISSIIFDKTGTLTLGEPKLVGEYDDDLLKQAASIAVHSQHPLSKALAASYYGDVDNLSDVKEYPGQGVEAHIDGHTLRLGSRAWCGDETSEGSDKIELWLMKDETPVIRFLFEDQLKEDSAEIVKNLKTMNLDVTLLSGDRKVIAQSIASECSIEHVFAEQKPTDKQDVLSNMQQSGAQVLMVGDGLNDAPVLAGANVSMAPGTAVDMAQNAADIIFMGDKLAPVEQGYKIALFTKKLVKENFALAIAYNCIAIPLAFAGLVTPMVAALAMSGSSILVIANSYRLKLLS